MKQFSACVVYIKKGRIGDNIMKKQITILIAGFSMIAYLSSCSSMQTSEDNYFGYNNKPKVEEAPKVQRIEPNVQYETTYDDVPQSISYQEPIVEERVVETNYVYFTPIAHYGYYPWWVAPRPYRFIEPYRPSGLSVSISFSNYDYWDYYWYNYHYRPMYPYYPYHHYDPYYGSVYYPYPYYYPYHYPRYYGSGWYESPRYSSTRPRDTRKDSYRDFGPSRGGYGSNGNQSQPNAPANRRSQVDPVPVVNTGAKTIYDNNTERSKNTRTSQTPSRETITNTPSNITPSSPNTGRSGLNNPEPKPIERQTPSNTNIGRPNEEQSRPVERSGAVRGEQPQRNPVQDTKPQDRPSREPAPAPRQEQPRQEAPRREAAPAPRSYEAPRREAPSTPSQPSPSRESSRPNKSDDSQPSNRRSR